MIIIVHVYIIIYLLEIRNKVNFIPIEILLNSSVQDNFITCFHASCRVLTRLSLRNLRKTWLSLYQIIPA